MKMHELFKKLQERPKTTDERLEALKAEWLEAIKALHAQLEEWLKPAIQAGTLKILRSSVDVREEDLGTYLAPVLRISDGRTTLILDPIGSRVVGIVGVSGKSLTGLQGRVDLLCGPIRIPLVRTSGGTWKALPLRGEPVDLTEESFAEILGEVFLDE